MSQRQAVSKAVAKRYKRADKTDKGTILDELCATTGWHRNHARKARAAGLRPMVVRPRRPRPPTYEPDVVAALRFCWAGVCTVVGYHRYAKAAELLLLNTIWVLQSKITNYFLPQQKLISKVRDGAKVTKKYDLPTTPHRRAEQHKSVTAEGKTTMSDSLADVNPAASRVRSRPSPVNC